MSNEGVNALLKMEKQMVVLHLAKRSIVSYTREVRFMIMRPEFNRRSPSWCTWRSHQANSTYLPKKSSDVNAWPGSPRAKMKKNN
ncbi:MAG: hypothetical protein JJU02_07190 [Cryomorphaceae bacterium]|nr:hypothetical protein [Cryomorphaceae bacterium]